MDTEKIHAAQYLKSHVGAALAANLACIEATAAIAAEAAPTRVAFRFGKFVKHPGWFGIGE
jgi:hypothetical protein